MKTDAMKTYPRITDFSEGTYGRWQWTIETIDTVTGLPMTTEYHTNGNHEGLWREGHQILGTCQFRLPHDRRRARSRVYDRFVRRDEARELLRDISRWHAPLPDERPETQED